MGFRKTSDYWSPQQLTYVQTEGLVGRPVTAQDLLEARVWTTWAPGKNAYMSGFYGTYIGSYGSDIGGLGGPLYSVTVADTFSQTILQSLYWTTHTQINSSRLWPVQYGPVHLPKLLRFYIACEGDFRAAALSFSSTLSGYRFSVSSGMMGFPSTLSLAPRLDAWYATARNTIGSLGGVPWIATNATTNTYVATIWQFQPITLLTNGTTTTIPNSGGLGAEVYYSSKYNLWMQIDMQHTVPIYHDVGSGNPSPNFDKTAFVRAVLPIISEIEPALWYDMLLFNTCHIAIIGNPGAVAAGYMSVLGDYQSTLSVDNVNELWSYTSLKTLVRDEQTFVYLDSAPANDNELTMWTALTSSGAATSLVYITNWGSAPSQVIYATGVVSGVPVASFAPVIAYTAATDYETWYGQELRAVTNSISHLTHNMTFAGYVDYRTTTPAAFVDTVKEYFGFTT